MAADRLAVLGIRPVEWSVRPAGLHLRWTFPPRLGFPPGGFQVYRRPAKRSDPPCIELTFEKDRVLPSGTTIQGVTLHVHESVILRGTGQPGLDVEAVPTSGGTGPLPLRMTFDGAAVAVAVRVRRPRSGAPIVLRAFDAADRVVAEATAQAAAGADVALTLRVDAPLIHHATLGLDVELIERICVETEARVCREDWGRPVKDLPLLAPAASGQIATILADRLGHDVRNFHAADLDAARERYGPGLPELLHWLAALVHGDPTRIDARDQGAPASRRRAVPRRRGSALGAVYPQSMLLLAALDANVARLLSLGWVDRFGAAGQDPVRGRAYDYKVVGRWREGERCGLCLGLGASVSGRPRVDPDVDAVVLPGVRWQGTDPLRRVGVRWRRPPAANAAQAAVAPVLFDVRRARETCASPPALGPAEALPGRRPALVPASSWETPLDVRFVDVAAPLGAYRYAVAGVDLFGQVGTPALGRRVSVKDHEAPPPPVRVSVTVVQPGYPWLTPADHALAASNATCAVRFEFGAFQLRQAPDAASFALFWRAGTLVDTEAVTLRVVSRDTRTDGRRALIVEVVQGAAGDATRFERAVVVPGWTPGAMPPSAERPRLRVERVDTQGLTRPRLALAAGAIDLPDGAMPFPATLILDGRRRGAWHEVPGASVLARAPVTGTMASDAAAGQTLTVRVRAVAAPPLPAPIPDGVPGDLGAPVPGLDVFIDRALVEADLFHAGAAEATAGSATILSSSSGRAAVDDTPEGCAGAARLRLGIDETTALTPGDTLTLPVGPGAGQPRLRVVEMTPAADPGDLPMPGGELAFEAAVSGRRVLVAAVVVSDVERAGARLRFLIRFPESVPSGAWPKTGDTVRYFPPYVVPPLSVGLAGGPDGAAIRLPIAASEGAATAYLALGTTDVRGNAGRLSAPVQITIVRPPPPAPGPPFPCGAPSATEGFATPPDRQGRATLCVGWTPPSAAAMLRFELARALDQTIVATDRRNWLIGRAAPGLPSVPPSAPIFARVVDATFDAASGLHRIGVDSSSGGLDATRLIGGCLAQGPRRFQVTGAGSAGGVTLLARRVAGTGDPIAGDDCAIEPAPDYSAVVGRPDKIRLLADKPGNEDAFGLVTGVPVAASQFRDELAGRGRDPFFYRVRAVDPAESRSPWSATSVPFWPVDTTPPAAPSGVSVTAGDRTATLAWSRPHAPVTHYRVLRSEAGATAPADAAPPYATVSVAELAPRPLALVAGGVVLPRPLTFEVDGQLGLDAIGAQLVASIRVAPRGADPGVNLVDAATSRAIFAWTPTGTGTLRVTVTALAGLAAVASDVPVVVSAGAQVIDGDPAAWSFTDHGLTGGTAYTYQLVAVRTVRAAPRAPGGPPRELLVPSVPSAPVTMRALDRSAVPAPTLLSATRGDPASGAALTLSLRAEGGARPSGLRVERRAAPDASWEIATLAGGWGWVAWPATDMEAVVVTGTDASLWWELRATVRLADGRVSAPSAPMEVS
jgi:hypothetical protein